MKRLCQIIKVFILVIGLIVITGCRTSQKNTSENETQNNVSDNKVAEVKTARKNVFMEEEYVDDVEVFSTYYDGNEPFFEAVIPLTNKAVRNTINNQDYLQEYLIDFRIANDKGEDYFEVKSMKWNIGDGNPYVYFKEKVTDEEFNEIKTKVKNQQIVSYTRIYTDDYDMRNFISYVNENTDE